MPGAWPDSAFKMTGRSRRRMCFTLIRDRRGWGFSYGATPSGKVRTIIFGVVYIALWREALGISPHGQPRWFFI